MPASPSDPIEEYIPNIGDIVKVRFHDGVSRDCEVIFVYPTIPATVQVINMSSRRGLRLVMDGSVRPTDRRVEHTRRTMWCQNCGNNAVEVGTLGTPSPVFTCFVCRKVMTYSEAPYVPKPPEPKAKPAPSPKKKKSRYLPGRPDAFESLTD